MVEEYGKDLMVIETRDLKKLGDWSSWKLSNANGDSPSEWFNYNDHEINSLGEGKQFAWRGRNNEVEKKKHIVAGRYGKLKICNSTEETVTIQIGGTRFTKDDLNILVNQIIELKNALK